MLTFDRARELLDYDPLTGIFFRKNGDKALGRLDAKGYCSVYVDGRYYKAAPLVMLWMTGEWPTLEVDHINRKRDDNRWLNLRLATRSQQLVNRKTKNATGFRGVYLHKKTGLYRAEIRGRSLGYFKSPECAHEAYCRAALADYGEYAVLKIEDRAFDRNELYDRDIGNHDSGC